MAYSTNDIKHEVACILFNIGALHTNLGAMDKRQTADGMKMSCSHFQCAAWAFHQLNENYPQSRETDLCIEVVAFLETISLAQAQECILEKSIFDARKPGNIAKVRFYHHFMFIIHQLMNLADTCSDEQNSRFFPDQMKSFTFTFSYFFTNKSH